MRVRSLPLALLVGLAGCDCGGTYFREVERLPSAGVAPANVEHGLACRPVEDAVRVSNTGEAPLVVSDVVIEGPGWTHDGLLLPHEIEPRSSLVIRLRGTSGSALLRITTNDPLRPLIDVPLSVVANAPPTLAIVEPVAGALAADGADLPLVARVSDDADPAGALTVRWTRADGSEVASAQPAAGGLATASWPAEGRPHGPESLMATVTDACGAQASARVSFCLDGTYSYEPFKLEGWSYDGSAEYDAGAGHLRLTPALPAKSGSAFELSQTVRGGAVDITFGFFAGNGTGADGFSLTALDASRMTTTVGPQGCGIGYGGGAECTTGAPLPGWSVEVDTYHNAEVDPTTSQHVAFTFDGALRNQPLWAALPRVNDAAWHEMQVKVQAPRVTVRVDGATYLDADVQGHFDFPAYLGFTASTGGLTDEHRIRALAVTGRYCDAAP